MNRYSNTGLGGGEGSSGGSYTIGDNGVKLLGRYAGIYDGTLSPEDLPMDIRGLVQAYGLDAN